MYVDRSIHSVIAAVLNCAVTYGHIVGAVTYLLDIVAVQQVFPFDLLMTLAGVRGAGRA